MNSFQQQPSDTDRIERSIVINAPRDRVWRALTTAETFGSWFGADLKGQAFTPGQRARGRQTGGCGHDDAWFDVVVERIEPQTLFAWRWHPYSANPAVDHAQEPPTLVTFTFADAAANATLVKVTETGFDSLPRHRWSEAFRMNGNGWTAQLENLKRHADT